jgi:hypothetical protein
MNINGAFPSTYLKAPDLAGRRALVTISHVKLEDVGDEAKPVLYFQGKEKGLVLNKTNANMITEITGSDETDHWKGKPIVLYVTKVDYQGKRVDGIRVDHPAANGNGTQPVAPPPPPEPLTVDDIPF